MGTIDLKLALLLLLLVFKNIFIRNSCFQTTFHESNLWHVPLFWMSKNLKRKLFILFIIIDLKLALLSLLMVSKNLHKKFMLSKYFPCHQLLQLSLKISKNLTNKSIKRESNKKAWMPTNCSNQIIYTKHDIFLNYLNFIG